MSTKPESRLEREQLMLPSVGIGNAVVSSGYGNLLGQVRCGTIVSRTAATFEVQFIDDEGQYIESYSLASGKRMCDVGTPDGWVIAKNEIAQERVRLLKPLQVDGIKLIHEDSIGYEGGGALRLDVYEYVPTGERYVKPYRIETVRKRGKLREVQQTVIVPISELVRLLAEFNANTRRKL